MHECASCASQGSSVDGRAMALAIRIRPSGSSFWVYGRQLNLDALPPKFGAFTLAGYALGWRCTVTKNLGQGNNELLSRNHS
jgi:hypothetical protein